MASDRAQIIARMLGDIPDEYDKTKGGYIYDAVAPMAEEAGKLWDAIDDAARAAFASTAEGDALDRIVYDRLGMTRKPATYAAGSVTFSGAPGTRIGAGTIVASDAAEYRTAEEAVLDAMGTATVRVIATESGEGANAAAGAIDTMPLTVYGVYGVTNMDAVTGGYPGETDAELRARYYYALRNPATSGNAAHYHMWATEVAGVGEARVEGLWDGPGTVRAVLLGTDGEPASETVVAAAAAHIETERPIGADVTVVAADEVAISVTATVTLADGVTAAAASANFAAILAGALSKDPINRTTVRYASVGALLLTTPGVFDYTALTVNGGTANVVLAADEIAVAGTVTLSAAV